jgi:hypothetical protein
MLILILNFKLKNDTYLTFKLKRKINCGKEKLSHD